MIEMTLDSVRENRESHLKVAILKATSQDRNLCIRIADENAYAIAAALQGIPQPRPLTHDLLKNIIEGLRANIVRVVISDVIDDIFYARIVLDAAGQQIEFDSRPSDAFALAVRTKSPIFAEECIVEQSGFTQESNAATGETTTEIKEERDQDSMEAQ